MQKLTKTGKPNNSAEPANEFKATAVLPYVAIYIKRDYIVKHTKILVLSLFTTMNNHNLFYETFFYTFIYLIFSFLG